MKNVKKETVSLKSKYDMFVKNRASLSELCKYWDLILKFIYLLKQLIAADREENWNTHLCTVQGLLPLFRAATSINYLRCASWYLEKMRKLPKDHPKICTKFIKGGFVVQIKPDFFNSTSPDMKLEQTINQSQKSSGGIMDQTRAAAYIRECTLSM